MRQVNAIAALLAVAWLSAGTVSAQDAAPALAPTDCAAAVAAASQLNTLALRDASGVCAAVGGIEDANYLLAIAQFRAAADLLLLPPATEFDEDAYAVMIWVYYFSSSVGYDEFYATPENVAALEERLRAVELTTDGGYDPGWAFRAAPRIDLYPQLIDVLREEGLWVRRYVGLLMQDEDYFAAFTALRAFEETHRGEVRPGGVPEAGLVFGEGIAVGTPEYDEWLRLRARQEGAHAMIVPPPPPKGNPILMAQLTEPPPDVLSVQAAIGFNGPAEGGAMVLRSPDEVRETWLPAALGTVEVETLLAKTDFESQALVVYALGRQTNASGELLLFELFHDEGFPAGTNAGYWISARLGTIDSACGQAPRDSFPFIVAVTANVPDAEVLDQRFETFPDQCGLVVGADPVTPG